jgi:protein CpxP
MSFAFLRLALVAGLALPLGLASASFALDAPPAPPGAPAAHQGHWRDPAERRAHLADHLRDVLQLQPGQEAALAAYLDAMKPPGDRAERMDHARAGMDEHLTTPQRLDKMLAHLDEMRTHMVARADATRLFYSQLSPPQQKAFDDLAPMMMHRMGDHHDGMEGGHHRGDGPGHEMGSGGEPPG